MLIWGLKDPGRFKGLSLSLSPHLGSTYCLADSVRAFSFIRLDDLRSRLLQLQGVWQFAKSLSVEQRDGV